MGQYASYNSEIVFQVLETSKSSNYLFGGSDEQTGGTDLTGPTDSLQLNLQPYRLLESPISTHPAT
jgi:hypothetical protein